MKIVFASANAHKISEVAAIMPKNIEIIGLREIGLTQEIPEPGKTIAENSFHKAMYVRNFLKASGQDYPVFADDSGLEVDALNGQPGVYSAMYAGQHGDHAANNKKLLAEMKLQTNRKARFVTVITYLDKRGSRVFDGEVKGTIAYEARGAQGFGYDPLFIPTGYRSTFAELGADVKNTISHRGEAVRKLAAFLGELKIMD